MKNALTMHSTAAKYANLATNIQLAAAAGFDALELTRDKLYAYLDSGYGERDLKELTAGLSIPGVGWLENIERQGAGFDDLMNEARRLFHVAEVIGARGVQLLTGPLDVNAVRAFAAGKPYDGYTGLLGKSVDEQIRLTAANVSALADLAARHGLVLYLEALGWAPLNSVFQMEKIARLSGKDNVRVLVDFWHCYAAGDRPEQVAGMDGKLLYGIHVCDSLPFDRGIADEGVLRNVALGDGVVPLEEWVRAGKATGYDGWWCSEVFSTRLHQDLPSKVAGDLHARLAALVGQQ